MTGFFFEEFFETFLSFITKKTFENVKKTYALDNLIETMDLSD
jgi:hypothetical protein